VERGDLRHRVVERGQHEVFEQRDVVGVDRRGVDRHGVELVAAAHRDAHRSPAGLALDERGRDALLRFEHLCLHVLRRAKQRTEVETTERVAETPGIDAGDLETARFETGVVDDLRSRYVLGEVRGFVAHVGSCSMSLAPGKASVSLSTPDVATSFASSRSRTSPMS